MAYGAVPPLTAESVTTTAQAAARAVIPQASAIMPPATALDGAKGSAVEYARSDHTHAARVQRMIATADTSGTATVTFARPFAVEPAINAMLQGTGSDTNGRRVVSIEYALLTTTDGQGAKTWTGATLVATTSKPLPQVTGLLTDVISALTKYNPTSPIAGAKMSVFASDPTQ